MPIRSNPGLRLELPDASDARMLLLTHLVGLDGVVKRCPSFIVSQQADGRDLRSLMSRQQSFCECPTTNMTESSFRGCWSAFDEAAGAAC